MTVRLDDFCICRDLDNLSRAAARLFVEQHTAAVAERDCFQVAVSGGTTPDALFRLLVTDYRDAIDWNKVHVFWCDERCVPPHDPGSNYGRARAIFLDHTPVPQANIHRIKGELGPENAAEDYAATLAECASPPFDFPRFDLAYLGLGEDGHTASLFPGSPVDAARAVVPATADYQGRPASRVTLTQQVFNEARMVVFMVAGAGKAKALAQTLSNTKNPAKYPAQRIEPQNGRLIWLVDEAAAGKLPADITGK